MAERGEADEFEEHKEYPQSAGKVS